MNDTWNKETESLCVLLMKFIVKVICYSAHASSVSQFLQHSSENIWSYRLSSVWDSLLQIVFVFFHIWYHMFYVVAKVTF
jgi:hypothetical protein